MPKRLLVRTVAIVACMVPVGWSGPASASAATPGADVFVATITGTLDPGFPPSGCVSENVDFDSTSFVLAGDDTQSGGIDFNGNSDSCETFTAGTGVGVINGVMNGLINYTRNGLLLTFFGTVNVNGITHTIFEFACVVIPSSIQPADTFNGICAGVLTS